MPRYHRTYHCLSAFPAIVTPHPATREFYIFNTTWVMFLTTCAHIDALDRSVYLSPLTTLVLSPNATEYRIPDDKGRRQMIIRSRQQLGTECT